MSTQRMIDLALHLLRKSNYGTFRVGGEHHRLCGYDPTFTGTVATWLIRMPNAELDRLVDTLADRADPRTFYEAERLLAVLTVLLPGEPQTMAEIAALPACSSGYATRLDALAADVAIRADQALRRRFPDVLGPIKMLDAAHQARELLISRQIPLPGRDPITDPIARAIHAAATWIAAEHDEPSATAMLIRTLVHAVKESGW